MDREVYQAIVHGVTKESDATWWPNNHKAQRPIFNVLQKNHNGTAEIKTVEGNYMSIKILINKLTKDITKYWELGEIKWKMNLI